MGFFSWKTQDTNRSIANKYSVQNTFTVYLIDDKGNYWREDAYEGEGRFGGKDYFVLLAEMNRLKSLDTDELRQLGRNLAHSGKKNIKFPNLVEHPESWQYIPSGPAECENQGYFYPNCEEYTTIANSADFQAWLVERAS